jgi:hypothetical protein
LLGGSSAAVRRARLFRSAYVSVGIIGRTGLGLGVALEESPHAIENIPQAAPWRLISHRPSFVTIIPPS